MTGEERAELLADEWLIVRNSGEIPEIAFYSSLYYLSDDADGPHLALTEEEVRTLKEAAAERYREIILRDMLVENFDKTIYRGIRRAIFNWQRLQTFGRRQGVECSDFREIAGRSLRRFLEQGSGAAGNTLPRVFINCSLEELIHFGKELGLEVEELPTNLHLCCLGR